MNFVFLLLFAVALIFMTSVVSDANARFEEVNKDNRFLKNQVMQLSIKLDNRAKEIDDLGVRLDRVESDRSTNARFLAALREEKRVS